MSKVPLLDLTRADPEVTAELRSAFERVLASGRFILGPDVAELERECVEAFECGHALGVSSGTDALTLALMALGVGPGDEVICPTFTFFATAGCVWRLGARPVFADIDRSTFNCDPGDVTRRITPRTRAVIPVHLYGQAADMQPLLDTARQRGLHVVEDAAQAIGARWRGRPVGTLGTFGCFSFFPTKNLGALGDGGLLTTLDADLAARARVLHVHGMDPKYHHRLVGANFRLDTLQAAFLRVKLRHLDAETERRRENARTYRELFAAAGVLSEDPRAPGTIELPREGPHGHTWNQFCIRIHGPDGARDSARASLTAAGIGTEVYYPLPLHLQPCFAELGHRPGDFPESERAARETLALPIFPGLRREEIETVVGALADWCRTQR
jgi:dTDP-4-amino-4,6-dideoxygalactose transaminase